jgi:predicted Zn-dependent protease
LWAKDRSRAQSLLESALKRWPEDPALWQKQAKLYADREPLRYHYALGNGYFYQHRFGPALEQYQLAHDSQGEDFYLRSVLDVRMREAQQRLQEEKNAKS